MERLMLLYWSVAFGIGRMKRISETVDVNWQRGHDTNDRASKEQVIG